MVAHCIKSIYRPAGIGGMHGGKLLGCERRWSDEVDAGDRVGCESVGDQCGFARGVEGVTGGGVVGAVVDVHEGKGVLNLSLNSNLRRARRGEGTSVSGDER